MLTTRECLKCRTLYYKGEEFCPLDGTQLSVTAACAAPDPAAGTQPKAVDPNLGRLIAGRFVLKEFAGGGTMGVVYRATHKVLEKSFAVKLLRREFIDDERALRRFYREAKAASCVDHSNIVRMHDFGKTEDNEPYLVMEHVHGTTLYQAMYQVPNHRLLLSRAIDILLQVARALAHAHGRGVIHRDIKPENILLTDIDGVADWVKILDFGVAKIIGQPPLSVAGEVLGTPEFISPEALTGAQEVGGPADLYALGIMLHDTIAGSPPFSGELREVLQQHLTTVPALLSQRRFDVAIPPDLDALAAQLLSKDPARRPSAPEAVSALEQIRASLPPRSLRSLLLAQTLILPPGQRQEKFSQQKTMIFADGAKRAQAPQVSGLSQGQLFRSAMATMISSSLLREIDVLEDELSRVSGRLSELCGTMLRRLWPQAAPQDVGILLGQIARCEEVEQELGTRLALLQEQLEQERQRVQVEQEKQRRKVLELSERSQEAGLSEDQRQAIARDIEDRERQFFAMETGEKSLAGSLPAAIPLAQAQERMQSVLGDLHKLRGLLGRRVLHACPVELSAERRRLEQLLAQLDAATAVLTMMGAEESTPQT